MRDFQTKIHISKSEQGHRTQSLFSYPGQFQQLSYNNICEWSAGRRFTFDIKEMIFV